MEPVCPKKRISANMERVSACFHHTRSLFFTTKRSLSTPKTNHVFFPKTETVFLQKQNGRRQRSHRADLQLLITAKLRQEMRSHTRQLWLFHNPRTLRSPDFLETEVWTPFQLHSAGASLQLFLWSYRAETFDNGGNGLPAGRELWPCCA